MSKGTLHGITQAFLDLGVITQDSNKKFRLGPTLIELGNKALAGDDLRLSVRPFLEELYSEFKETLFLGTSDGKKITIIDKVDSPSGLKIPPRSATRRKLKNWEYGYCADCRQIRFSSELEATPEGIRCSKFKGYKLEASGWTICPHHKDSVDNGLQTRIAGTDSVLKRGDTRHHGRW